MKDLDKREMEVANELLAFQRKYFHPDTSHNLRGILLRHFENPEKALMLDCIMEQGEDIYIIITDKDHVFEVEVDRIDLSSTCTERSMRDYERLLSKLKKRKLLVALKIIS